MKQSIELRQSQRLTMTPQLQQAVKLLQMSTTELNEEIQLAHDTNPLLEFAEEAESAEVETEPSNLDSPLQSRSSDQQPALGVSEEAGFDSDIEGMGASESDWTSPMQYELTDVVFSNTSQEFSEDYDRLSQVSDQAISLRQALTNQAVLLFSSDQETLIGYHIIQNLDEAGYLEVPLDEIHQQIASSAQCELADVEKVLMEIQTLEPTGVGARSPEECLLLQLQLGDDSRDGHALAESIVRNHLQLLGSKDYGTLQKQLGVSEKQLSVAVKLITELDPHPGYKISNTRIDYIAPDILVEKIRGAWLARLNQKNLPRLSINDHYRKLIKSSNNGDFGSLKEQLQNAKWLLNNLEKRQKTILSVAREIVERQQSFFDEGAAKIKPMKLSDIAEPLGIHESTVSRATNGKYLLGPQGVYELKYFFSSQLAGDDGEWFSSLAIQTEIKRIIENENPRKPISDEKICSQLKASGTQIARRTVAKYREQLNIPASSKRKSL